MTVVAAVDCGATSVRVCRVDLGRHPLVASVVHRVHHRPRRDGDGRLRWDWHRIVAAVIEGLERCRASGPLDSIGVDTWAADYGLLDESGALLAEPISYRDADVAHSRAVLDACGRDAMYAINGLQPHPFNTIFQLARHDRAELERAARLLWLPELIVHALTGVSVTERTSAGSSGLVDLTTGGWSPALLEVAGVDPTLLGEIVPAGRIVGEWQGIPVSLVAGHDTASAVVGMGLPSPGGTIFVASGTWMLVGTERAERDTSDWARRHFSNEVGAIDGFRLLRNVAGFWILEECRQAWHIDDVTPLLESATHVVADVPIVDVDDERLRAPADMLVAYTELAGLSVAAAPVLVTRSVVESIAAGVAAAVSELSAAHGATDVMMFGGAARNGLLRDRIEALTAIPVRRGPVEATAVGNAIVQGVAVGRYRSLDEGRACVLDGDDER